MSVVGFSKYHQAKQSAKERTAEIIEHLKDHIEPHIFLMQDVEGNTLEEMLEDDLYQREKAGLT